VDSYSTNQAERFVSGDSITVYEKTTCTTCRKLVKLLEEEGVDFRRVNYYVEPLTEAQLRELLGKARLSPRDVIRTREPAYREMGLDDPDVGDEVLLDALVRHPDLLQRPIVERGARAVLARPVENVRSLLRDG
jgi:arsenate reductase